MKTIYLVRHGETYLNKFFRIQGWSDAPLTEEGEQVVIETGKKLKDKKFDLAVSSDLKRAVDSRDLILKENKAAQQTKLVTSPLFREEFFGYFDSMDEHDVAKKISQDSQLDTFAKILATGKTMPELRNQLKQLDPYHYCESQAEIEERVAKAFNWLDHYDDSQSILLIGHGFLTQLIVQMYGQGKFDASHLPPNSSLTLLHLNNGQVSVESYGQKL